jgi:hypothetical protein
MHFVFRTYCENRKKRRMTRVHMYQSACHEILQLNDAVKDSEEMNMDDDDLVNRTVRG